MKRKEPIRSDGDEDDVPLASLLPKPDTCIVSADVAVPIGEACIGLEVARDFGGSHGVCKGNIVRSVDSNRRRPLYHVLYADGDEEDYDYEELYYALQLISALKNGTHDALKANDHTGCHL